MNPELKQEITRLRQILSSAGMEFQPVNRTSDEQLKRVENETGIKLGSDLRDFYKYSNGSNEEIWFAVFSDELTPCAFPDIEDARESWSELLPYDQSVYEEWSDFSSARDERIKPGYLHHRLWFPIAEFNGYSTGVYFDADPADKGQYGQIIVYQHDPDAIYYVASSFLEFFRTSNDLLEKHAEELLL